MFRKRRVAAILFALVGVACIGGAQAAAEPVAAERNPGTAGGGLRVEECREKARSRNPLSRRYELIDRGARLDLAIAKRGYLPRLSLSAKASYQSDVTSLESLASYLPSQLASAFEGIGGDKDQYQALAEFSQTIWDGGAIAAQAKAVDRASSVERGKLDVDIYALNDRVDQLFFGVLSIREQITQNEILLGQLDSSFRRVEASLRNGVASPYDLDAVRVEVLNARQRGIELAAGERAYRETLAELIGEPIPEGSAFSMPLAAAPSEGDEARARPEYALFSAQERQLESQEAAIRAANRPRLSAFFQAAYGQPGLNMYKNGFTEYWIGGLKISWSLNGLLDVKDQFDKIDTVRKSIEAQRDAFTLNNEMQVTRLRKDIEKLRALLESDDEVVVLREGMRRSTEAKYDNGAATLDEVLKAIDAESLARRMKSLHEVQLAASVYSLKNTLAQ